MKPLSTAIGAMALTLLAGCASTSDKAAAYHAPAQASSLSDRDEVYIAAVNRKARIRGVHVEWVNLPHKRPASTEN